MHDTHGGFDILAIAGAFVEGLAVLLDGAEDTGALLNVADKVLRRFLHGGKIRVILPCLDDLPVASCVSVAAPNAHSATYVFSLSTR